MSQNNQKVTSTILGFDVGGTRVRAGLISGNEISSFATLSLSKQGGAEGALSSILQLGRQMIKHQPVEAIGVALRGIVDPLTGTLLDVNGPLSEYIGQPIASLVASELGIPVLLENDARMYALGELIKGAGRGYHNIVCLTLGTGIGCSVALEGRILRGKRGLGGILGGHITVQTDGPYCSCGNKGCLEALIGTDALTKAVQNGLHHDPSSLLRDGPGDPEHLFQAGKAEDPLAQRLIARFSNHLGSGIVSLIHAYDPDIVILGGGMMQAFTQFLVSVQTYVNAHAWTLPRERVKIVPAQLGDAAALIGIAAYMQHPDMLC